MEKSELEAFVRVVEAGGFSAASRRHQMDKAQLSRLVARLESSLATRLLHRSTRALSLTETGRAVYERAINVLHGFKDIEQVVRAHDALPRGTLRVTCGVEFGLLLAGRWITGFMQQHPEIAVEAEYSGRLVDLVAEGFDLGIRVGRLQDSNLGQRQLGELTYGLYASAAYLERSGQPDSIEALDGHQMLGFYGDRGRLRLGLPGARTPDNVRVRFRVNNAFALRDAAEAGLGIARLPTLLADASTKTGRLIRLLPMSPESRLPVHAVFSARKQLPLKVRAFIDYASSNFGIGDKQKSAEV